MDWLWPLYRKHIERLASGREGQRSGAQEVFLASLAASTATLYALEPVYNTVRFKGLGRWPLPEVPRLLGDPNAFIADRFGGGKFKINFHHGECFVATD